MCAAARGAKAAQDAEVLQDASGVGEREDGVERREAFDGERGDGEAGQHREGRTRFAGFCYGRAASVATISRRVLALCTAKLRQETSWTRYATRTAPQAAPRCPSRT
eukprot:5789562-Prymnesium_polylepis.1